MSQTSPSLTLQPIQQMHGEVTLPGSKSLSNRALLLAALAEGETHLTNLLKSDDTERMVVALRQLGVRITLDDSWQNCTVIGGHGLFAPTDEKLRFNLGNAGTAIRPLSAILSLVPGTFEIDGDEYMRERPIGQLVDALKQLGADITYLQHEGYPPFEMKGGAVKAGKVDIPGNISSQYLTSLLMSLPLIEGNSTIHVIGDQVSKPYLDITLGIVEQFGVTASHENHQHFTIPGGQQYRSPGSFLIEGDASSASYFFGAAAIAGGPIRVHGIGESSVQGDIQFLDTIEQMGATVQRSANWVEVTGGELKGIDVDLNHIPDAAMTIAAIALFADGPTHIRNIYNWRVKETDRMHAMAEGLTSLGAAVKTTEDAIYIEPPETIKPASIDTYGDHRIAMSFSLAALGTADVTIQDPDCTRKTFPDYFDVFQALSSS